MSRVRLRPRTSESLAGYRIHSLLTRSLGVLELAVSNLLPFCRDFAMRNMNLSQVW